MSNYKPTIDRDIVEELSISRKRVGEVYPIIVDWDGEVLAGVHRKQAGWRRTHTIDTRKLAEKWGVTSSQNIAATTGLSTFSSARSIDFH